MLRSCVSWRVPRLSVLPITVIDCVVLLGGGTVPMFRYPSNDFDRRAAGGFLAVGELKSETTRSLVRRRINDVRKDTQSCKRVKRIFLKERNRLRSRVNQPGRNPPRLRPVTLGTFASVLISASSKTRALAAMCSLQSIPSSAMRRSRPMLMPRIFAASRVLMSLRLVWIAITMP